MSGRRSIIFFLLTLALLTPVHAEVEPKAPEPVSPPVEATPETPADAEPSVDVTVPIVPDRDQDLELLKSVIDGLDDEKLSKRFERVKKKKDSLDEELEAFKKDVMISTVAQGAWRETLHETFGITAKNVTVDCPSMDEVKQRIAAEHTQRLQKKYPPSLMAALEKQAIARFPIAKVGDVVTVRLRSGRQISGRVNRMDAAEAMVGSTTVPIEDLDPRFHLDTAKQNRRTFVRQNYYDKRKAFETALREKLPPYLLAKNGYVRYDGTWTSAKHLAARINARIAYLADRGEVAKVERKQRFDTIKSRAIQIGGIVAGVVVLVLILILVFRKRK